MSIAAAVLQRQGVQPSSANQPHSQAKPVAPSQLSATTPKVSPHTAQTAQPRIAVPARHTEFEPAHRPSTVNDDPVFDTRAAATILGVSYERLKKWRQRRQGPDYIQYVKGGAVRYALSALMKFRAAHTVRIGVHQ